MEYCIVASDGASFLAKECPKPQSTHPVSRHDIDCETFPLALEQTSQEELKNSSYALRFCKTKHILLLHDPVRPIPYRD